MNKKELDAAIHDLSKVANYSKETNMYKAIELFKEYPKVFLLTVHNNSTLQVESEMIRNDLFDEDSKFKTMMEKITGKSFKYVETPSCISNYFYDLAEKIKNNPDTTEKFSSKVKGSEIRYVEEGGKSNNWKYLDDELEFEVQYVKPLYNIDLVNDNKAVLTDCIDNMLRELEEKKEALLNVKQEHGLFKESVNLVESVGNAVDKTVKKVSKFRLSKG